MRCPLCHTPLSKALALHFYDCHNCSGLVKDAAYHLSPPKEKAHYLTHLNDVLDAGYRRFTSPISQYVLKHFTPAQLGLDFGSGTGPVISEVLKESGYRTVLYDPYFAPRTEALAQSYDYIFSCEVVEHFKEPRIMFEKLHGLLKPGGQLIIMTALFTENIDLEKWRYARDPTHVFIYRRETMWFIAKELGFSSVDVGEKLAVFKKSGAIGQP